MAAKVPHTHCPKVIRHSQNTLPVQCLLSKRQKGHGFVMKVHINLLIDLIQATTHHKLVPFIMLQNLWLSGSICSPSVGREIFRRNEACFLPSELGLKFPHGDETSQIERTSGPPSSPSPASLKIPSGLSDRYKVFCKYPHPPTSSSVRCVRRDERACLCASAKLGLEEKSLCLFFARLRTLFSPLNLANQVICNGGLAP